MSVQRKTKGKEKAKRQRKAKNDLDKPAFFHLRINWTLTREKKKQRKNSQKDQQTTENQNHKQPQILPADWSKIMSHV